jgi:rare lipoprotein A
VTSASLRASLLTAVATLAIVAPATAGTGGATAPAPGEPPSAGEPAAPPEAPRSGVVSVDGPVAVEARAGTLLGEIARFRGSVRRRDAGRRVVVQRFDERADRWLRVARTEVDDDGSFVARWRTDHSGRLRLRALLRARPAGQARSDGTQVTTASAELGVTIYLPARATWYGPGFFGNRTACGQVLTETTVGVAHRTLPCGTNVALLYEGRALIVPVIDRGPYADADWDLTQATARALELDSTDTVGAVALR